MKTWRIILALAVVMLGTILGLSYGWLVDPVEYIDTSPASLRIDYQTDVVLMISDIFVDDMNLNEAFDRLSWLNNQDVTQMVSRCLDYATQMKFSEQDINKIRLLQDALIAWQNEGTTIP